MDLDNQNSATANTNTDSAANDFGAPISFVDQTAEMNTINEAIAATDGASAAPQTAFDINDISLDDVPNSQDELNRRLEADPGMNLAGGPMADPAIDPVAAVNPTLSALSANAAAAGEEPTAEKPAAPSASFVDGDIVDEAEATATQPAEAPHQYDNINADPLANFETAPIDQSVPQATPADPATTPAETPASPIEQPAAATDAVAANPGRKSKMPIIIVAGVVVVAIIVGVVIFLVTKK